ncbi:Mitochondrial import receptor subunit tom22 [Colletotrichum spinosum]|uniref:Mitochondrial import receptor subunit tom22 n=1 Tax=Colletotrichum spinosum TaxID=1347390 RepID=A0A4R8Q8J5_9PEZI|nr:Mitochondrial import receptor subunit tom22 [Colletotrichum spinosum]
MGPGNTTSRALAQEYPPTLHHHQSHPYDALLDDYGHFRDLDFASQIHRHTSIFGWKKALRQGHYQQANLVGLLKLGLFANYPVGFNLWLHTPPGYLRDRILEVLAKYNASTSRIGKHHCHRTTDKMVQLTEVEDEHFQASQAGPIEDDGDYTDTDSEISADSDFDPADESFTERLYALKDMIPPTTRGWVANKVNFGVSAVQNTWYYGSRTVWVVCATALMIGVPLATCWAEDQQIEGMEREFRMREAGGELLTAGAGGEENTADILGAHLDKTEAKPAL